MAASQALTVCVCLCVCVSVRLAFKINGSIAIEMAIAIPKAYSENRFSSIFSDKNAKEKKSRQSVWKSAIYYEKSSYRLAASASNYLRSEFSYRYRHSDTVYIVSQSRKTESTDSEKRSRNSENQKQSFLQPRQQLQVQVYDPKCRHLIVQFTTTTMHWHYTISTALKNMKM